MSDEVLAPIITVGLLAAFVLWVPTLHFCNARCQQLLRGRFRRPETEAAPQGTFEMNQTGQ